MIIDVISSRTAKTDSRKVSNNREDSNIQQDISNISRNSQSQLEHKATAAEKTETSQTSTAKGKPATARMPEIVEISQQQY
jgi:hypothetical protein